MRPPLIEWASEAFRMGAGQLADYQTWDAELRASAPAARRVDCVGLTGGTGCSHLAARLGVLLAHRRGGRVLGVDAGANATFTRLVGAVAKDVPPANVPGERADRRLHAPVSMNLADEAISAMRVGRAGLVVTRPEGWEKGEDHTQRRPSDWLRSAEPVRRFFDIVVTDWGRRSPAIDLEQAISGSQVVALVCRADRASLEQAVSVASGVSAATPCVVCAVDVTGSGWRAARVAARWGVSQVHYLPFLEAPAVGLPSFATRRALVGLAATLVRHTLAGGKTAGDQ